MQNKFRIPLVGFGVSILLLPLITQAAYNWKASFVSATKTNEIAIGETVRTVSDTRVNFEGVGVKTPKQAFGDKTKWSLAVHSEVTRQRIDEESYATKSDFVFNNVTADTTMYYGKEKKTNSYNFSDIISIRTISKDSTSYIQIANLSADLCKLVTSFVGPCSSLINQWIRVEGISSVTDSSLGKLVGSDAESGSEEKLKKLTNNDKLKNIPVLQPLRLVKTYTKEDGMTYAVIESKISQTFVNTAIAEYRKTTGAQDPVAKAEMNEVIRLVNIFVAQSRILTTINTQTNTISTVDLKGKMSGDIYDVEAIRNKARMVIGAKRVRSDKVKIDIFNTSAVERNIFEDIQPPETSKTFEEFINYLSEETTAAQDTDGDQLFDVDELRFFGTDPNKADSDDDGYDDREELVKGYNPNGEGKSQ